MNLTPFTSLTWAYQLHYYLCFRTRRRRTLFSSERQVNLLSQLIQEISANHDYRLLNTNLIQLNYAAYSACDLRRQSLKRSNYSNPTLLADWHAPSVFPFLCGLPDIWRGVAVLCEFRRFANTWRSSQHIMDISQECCHQSIDIEQLSLRS